MDFLAFGQFAVAQERRLHDWWPDFCEDRVRDRQTVLKALNFLLFSIRIEMGVRQVHRSTVTLMLVKVTIH